jgi:hypothetical protein
MIVAHFSFVADESGAPFRRIDQNFVPAARN